MFGGGVTELVGYPPKWSTQAGRSSHGRGWTGRGGGSSNGGGVCGVYARKKQ